MVRASPAVISSDLNAAASRSGPRSISCTASAPVGTLMLDQVHVTGQLGHVLRRRDGHQEHERRDHRHCRFHPCPPSDICRAFRTDARRVPGTLPAEHLGHRLSLGVLDQGHGRGQALDRLRPRGSHLGRRVPRRRRGSGREERDGEHRGGGKGRRPGPPARCRAPRLLVRDGRGDAPRHLGRAGHHRQFPQGLAKFVFRHVLTSVASKPSSPCLSARRARCTRTLTVLSFRPRVCAMSRRLSPCQ